MMEETEESEEEGTEPEPEPAVEETNLEPGEAIAEEEIVSTETEAAEEESPEPEPDPEPEGVPDIRDRDSWMDSLAFKHVKVFAGIIGVKPAGQTKASFVKAIREHPDNRVDQIIVMYDQLLNRFPDMRGFQAYYDHLKAGKPIGDLRRSVQRSSEYINLQSSK